MDLAEKLTGPLEEALTAAFSQVHPLILGRSKAFITGHRSGYGPVVESHWV